MRFSVESWAPEYGIAADGEWFADRSEDVEIDVERKAADWNPIQPASVTALDRIMFVDGIRRIDARIWIHDGDRSHVGVCASVAAGVVSCAGPVAEVLDVVVERGVYATAASGGGPIVTKYASYEFRPTADDEVESTYLAIHGHMTALEQSIADTSDCDLIVFDGPLRGRNDPAGVGYVKTHQVQYLPDDVIPILGKLGDGQRTPVFLIGGHGFTRYCWYLRLPGPRNQPLSGIVRLELPGTGTAQEAVKRAEEVSARLPRFASQPHKEPRAPQNLYPIAGLEHTLRRRLGDANLLDRGLRLVAAGLVP